MKATKYVITKTTQQEKQLLESLEIAGRKGIERINSAKKELESLIKAAEFTKISCGYHTEQKQIEAET